jgi:ribosomal protein S18 acetylase RimI-like enzyme
VIRPLTIDDLEAYRALWLDGLRRVPDAFLLTEGEALALTEIALIAKLQTERIWGSFSESRLNGLISMQPGRLERLRHMADIGPLYVHPSAQGQGIARELLSAAIATARDMGLMQLELCVDAKNTRAIALYQAAGFVEFGRRPRSVIVNGTPRDDLLMLKALDAA